MRTAFLPREKVKIDEKLLVARKRNAENAKNNVSLASDGQKTAKTGFRSQAKCKKWEKQRFACKRRAKNGENCPSLVSETQNHPISAFRPGRKCGAGVLFVVVGFSLDDGAGSVELLGKEEPYHLVGEGEP